MYHVIGSAKGLPYPKLAVAPHDFAAEVQWLAANRYDAVTLDRVYAHWRTGAPLPRKPVVFSFDDGYPGDVDVALPVLRRRGWPAVLNLQIGNLGRTQVRKLIAAGWEIDAHTFTHPDLTTVRGVRLHREIAGARAWIRRVFHQPVLFFCYPSGRYDSTVIAEVKRAGYLGATTPAYGFASPRNGMFTLPRIRVDRGDSRATFAAKLHGGRR